MALVTARENFGGTMDHCFRNNTLLVYVPSVVA